MSPIKYSYKQFVFFRLCFGIFLFFHFIRLLFYSEELFGENFSYALIAGALASLFFILGCFRKIAAVLIWLLFVVLLRRTPLYHDFDLDYMGWLLLATLFITEDHKEMHIRSEIYWGAWLVLSVGYFLSGLSKFTNEIWISGQALESLKPQLFRFSFFLKLPTELLRILTWWVLFSEILFFPLFFFKKIRPYAWLSMAFVHIGIAITTRLTELSVSVLFFHLFIFDTNWIKLKHAQAS